MARAHADHEIKPVYVKEVCRLLKNSNINLSKHDIELEGIQEEINENLRRDREQQQSEMNQPVEEQKPAEAKKVKISFEEYQRLSYMILEVMKEFRAQD